MNGTAKPQQAIPIAVASRTRFNKRQFAVLFMAGVASLILALPYESTLLAPLVEKKSLPISFALLLTIKLVEDATILGLFVALGLALAPRCGLGAPLVERWLAGESLRGRIAPLFKIAVPSGVLVFAFALGIDKFFFHLGLPNPAVWRGLLASFTGGIAEELIVRWGAMSFLAWLLGKAWHDAQGAPAARAFWSANVIAAVLFGLGHLPTMSAVLPLTSTIMVRELLLNGVAGLIFGYLYWKRGLESAMVAHFSADVLLHALVLL